MRHIIRMGYIGIRHKKPYASVINHDVSRENLKGKNPSKHVISMIDDAQLSLAVANAEIPESSQISTETRGSGDDRHQFAAFLRFIPGKASHRTVVLRLGHMQLGILQIDNFDTIPCGFSIIQLVSII